MFINEVSKYFMNFLETDFKRRRLPKRSNSSKDRAGNLLSFRLSKYPTFRRKIISLIDDSRSEFSVEIGRGKFKSTISENLTELITEQTIRKLNETRGQLIEILNEQINKLFIDYENDQETFLQESIATISELVNTVFIQHSVKAVEGTLQRIRESEEEDSGEIAEALSNFIVSEEENEIQESLKQFLVHKKIETVESSLERLLSEENIKLRLKDFFHDFSIKDMHAELFELSRNKKLREEFELYLYFGEVRFSNRSYPIFFIPINIEEFIKSNKMLFKLTFDKRFYINKSAIEYVYQELKESNTAAQIANSIGERITYVDENEKLSDVLTLRIRSLLSHLGADGDVDFSKDFLTTASNPRLSVNNNISISLFDKADESSINDYEELLNYLDGESGIGDAFSSLISGFIDGEPESIINKVLDEWSETKTSDRLVFSSPIPLNEEQRKIINAVNNEKARFITVQGPPGTGKSHTITAILFDAILKDKSVLMLSDKKEALDVVENKLEETLNQVRVGDNFQNPILRLGREGNTYAKILQTQNVESIRSHNRIAVEKFSQANPDGTEKSLKNEVNSYIERYSDIDIDQIKEYLTQKSEYEFTEEEEYQLIKSVKELKLLISSLSAIQAGIRTEVVSRISKEHQANTFPELKNLIQSIVIVNKQGDKRIGLDNLASFDINKKKYLKDRMLEYNQVQERFFSFLFGKFQLSDWNQSLNSELDFKEVLDFRDSENVQIIKNYLSVIGSFNTYLNRERKESKEKVLSLISQLIIEPFEEVEIKKLESSKKGLEDIMQLLDNGFIENYPLPIDLSDHQDVNQIDLGKMIMKLGDLERFIQMTKKLKDSLDVPKLNLNQEIKEVQTNATVEMVNIFDKRFIKFFDENMTTAKTLKKMIVKKQKFPREDLEKLRNAFPCIIAGIRDYADYVPLEPDLFDLIIIDEASQVSIAQAFPAILRAKKIIVLGDKKQFSNVKSSTASKLINSNYQDEIRQAFRKTYGDNPQKLERSKVFDIRVSILEFFENITNYDCLLKKHFRGYPEIISFSSKHFYNNELQTIKLRAKPIEDVISIHQVEHEGIDLYKNTNQAESEYIISEIEKLSQKKNAPSVGVITPMRQQQKYILSQLELSEKYDDIKKMNPKVMTFDSCQGEERDVIFYSFVDSPATDVSYRVLGSKLDTEKFDPEENLRLQRLNVGMSRAKEQIVLVISKPFTEMKGNARTILAHYNREIENAKQLPDLTELESPMERKVLEWIKQSKFYRDHADKIELTAQFQIGDYLKTLDQTYNHPSYRTDFLMTLKDGNEIKKLIIEYDGFVEHFVDRDRVNEFNYSHYYNEDDVEREKILEGYGFPFLRLNKFNLGRDPIRKISKELESFFFSRNSQGLSDSIKKQVGKLKSGELIYCPKCKKSKPKKEFEDKNLKKGIGRHCRVCKGLTNGKSRRPKRQRNIQIQISGNESYKSCRSCGTGLIEGHNWAPSRVKRHDYICGSCHGKNKRGKSGPKKRRAKKTDDNTCPKCGSKMVKRKNRSQGNYFLGCSKFPSCRGTRSL
tara:strand:- start:1592 stop:6208 length:4617 start_codon:yes stop_codon:yes gene_type:complete